MTFSFPLIKNIWSLFKADSAERGDILALSEPKVVTVALIIRDAWMKPEELDNQVNVGDLAG